MKKLILATTFLALGAVSLLSQGTARLTIDNDPVKFGDGIDRRIYANFKGDLITDAIGPVYVEAQENRGGVWTPLGDRILVNSDYGGAYPEYAGLFFTDGVNRPLSVDKGTEIQLRLVCFDAQQGGTQFPLTSLEEQGPISFLHPNREPNPSLPLDTFMVNLRAFPIIPEPSTIALGVLGIGALLLFRRRK